MKDAKAAAMGYRAAELMDERGVSPKKECAALGLGKNMYYSWRDGICAPSARSLRAMALRGYDVMYILTGIRRNNGQSKR